MALLTLERTFVPKIRATSYFVEAKLVSTSVSIQKKLWQGALQTAPSAGLTETFTFPVRVPLETFHKLHFQIAL